MIFGTYVHWLIHGTLINKNYANKISCRFTEKVCKFAIRKLKTQKFFWELLKELNTFSETPLTDLLREILLCKSPYSVQIRENKDQKNSKYGHFLRSDSVFRLRLRASLVIGSFLLKLKTIATCFEYDIFHNNLKDNVYGQVYSWKYCRSLPEEESIVNFFCVRIISSSKISRNCRWWSQSVTDDFMRVFWKLWKISRNTYAVEFSFKTTGRLLPEINVHRLKSLLQIFFFKCSEKKGCSKILQIPKIYLQNCLFLSDVILLQSRISNSTKTDSKKNVSCECSDIVENLPGKGLYRHHFINITEVLSRN